jgi:ATP-binding protein involved in chromosome partitioning
MASEVSEAQVLDTLRPIVDPDLGRSIVDLGCIANIAIEGGRVSFGVEFPLPDSKGREEVAQTARASLLALDGVTEVDVSLSSRTRSTATPNTTEQLLPGVKNTIAVASGKGGVGKSTVAVSLALGLRAGGCRVGILDADVYGPSLPLLTGTSGQPQAINKRIYPMEAYGLKLMSMGYFVNENSPVIWRGPMVHGLIKQFLSDVEWGELDYLLIDLPPGTGDAALTLTQQAPLSGAVIITTANDLSIIDARKGLSMFQKVNVPVLGIVENMSYFVPPDLPDRRYYIFGQGGGERVSKELGVDFLGEIPIDPRVAEGGDQGRPIVVHAPESPTASALEKLSRQIARKLALMAVETPIMASSELTWV